MRFELVIILIAGFIMANIYTDGRYVRLMMTWKKYYQMVGVAFGALMLYILLKNNPLRTQQIVSASNDYIKYLPIDKNTGLTLDCTMACEQNTGGKHTRGCDGYIPF